VRILGGLLALICLALAAFIVIRAGLPNRADYTGFTIPSGEHVAPEIAAIAPDFQLTDSQGNRFTLWDQRGRVVLVNFWATWCEPCRIEMPELNRLFTTYAGRALDVIAVNLGESLAAIQEWRSAYALEFPLLLDTQMQVAVLYQIRGQPSTYIIAPDGRITAIFYGPATYDSLQQAIAPLLPQ
jgi:peroxiredoxin